MADGLREALVAVVTWILVGVGRAIFPKQWGDLDAEKVRLLAVALVAVLVAVVAGVTQGLGAWGIVQLAFAAFAGSIAIRRTTKRSDHVAEIRAAMRKLSQDRGVRTGRANVVVDEDTKP